MPSAALALLPLALLTPLRPLPRRSPSPRMITEDTNSRLMQKLGEIEAKPQAPVERGNNGIGGRDRQKVNVGGAKLDADVAGAAVLEVQATEEHEVLFQQGVQGMRRGEYKRAVTAFTQAIAAYPGGMTTRKGGQYAVWLAQALHACGGTKRGDAMRLLKKTESHPDKDVRILADNVLYIFQAPELKLGEENFMKIPKLEEVDTWGRPRRQLEEKDPEPEKYSIEWYLERAKETERKNNAVPDPSRSSGSLAALGVLAVALGAVVVLT